MSKQSAVAPAASLREGLPSSIPANESSKAAGEYVNWTPYPKGPAGLTYVATRRSTGDSVIIRLLPWLANNAEQIESLQRRIRLTKLFASNFAPSVIEFAGDASPPVLVIQPHEGSAFGDWLRTAESRERLLLAQRLILSVEAGLRRGLVHGHLTNASICVQRGLQCEIDYFEPFYASEAPARSNDPVLDVCGLQRVLFELLSPVAHNEAVLSGVPGSTRAQLKSLLRTAIESQHVDSLSAEDTLLRWKEAIASVLAHHGQVPRDSSPIQHVSSETTSLVEEAISQARGMEPVDDTRLAPKLSNASRDATDRLHQLDATNCTAKIDDQVIALSTAAVAHPRVGDQLGRYRLEEVIGQGGMGMVFRGTDLSNDQPVAIKTLRPTNGDISQAVRRFRKEARILTSVQNEYVTQLLEIGNERGIHFIAMEFVAGTNLRDWMKSHNSIDEETALQIVGDIGRALIDAHQREIIHRDIKPENVLLAIDEALTDTHGRHAVRVKLTDFGIARHVNQSSSMEMTRAGTLLGTPRYMSPEQCKASDDVGPTSDVYSLGVTLYALLAGRLPFESDDPMRLAAMHCFEAPLAIQKRNASVSDATAALIHRMLAKSPHDRPADAAQLVREIDLILRGEISEFAAHPRVNQQPQGRLWERKFEWQLRSSPHELWPYVSNTERLNRAAGLQAVEYRTETDAHRGPRRFGSFRLSGLNIQWEEHPFEWVQGSRMGVLREFASGPFRWFKSVVELNPRPEGGCHLVHTVTIEPRNKLGTLLAHIEAGIKGGRALDRVYRRIDESLQTQRDNPLFDPFEGPRGLGRLKTGRLEQRFESMVQRGVTPETAERLIQFIRSAPPQVLAQIRPLDLANRLSVNSIEMLDACLVAAKERVLEIRWDILCPTCRAPAATEPLLNKINLHTTCEACDAAFQSNVADAIELVFQAHPEIQEIDTGKYCIGGPEHAPHVVSQVTVAPNEKLELRVSVETGDYILRSPRLTRQQFIRVRDHSAPSQLEVHLSRLGASNHVPVVRAGQLTVALTNDDDTPRVVRLERTIDRQNVVTAAVASALPRFRSLFPEQVFRSDVPVATEELTLLAARFSNVDDLYAHHGDADAYLLIQRALKDWDICVGAHRGATIKTVGETLMASFKDSVDAVNASLMMQSRCRESTDLGRFEMTIGVHRGPTLVTTQNGRLDYFGSTSRLVEALCKASEGCVLLTDAVFADAAIQDVLAQTACQLEVMTISLANTTDQLVQRVQFFDDAEQ